MARHICTIGLDIAKNVFQVHGVDESGEVVLRRKLQRKQVEKFFRSVEPSLIGIEATGSVNYWARLLHKIGHTVKVMPAAYVKPYVKTNKNDANDAEAICEAVRRPNMRFVPVKSEEQQAILSVHRARSLLVRQRVMITNAMRGLLAEFGTIVERGAVGERALVSSVEQRKIENLPRLAQDTLMTLAQQYREFELRIKVLEKQLMAWHAGNENCQRLESIPGIGPITATAIVASIGDARSFKSGRHMAAWVGLVPRQASSGGKTVLRGVSKRGNKYLRNLLFMGAFAAMMTGKRSRHRIVQRALKMTERKPYKVAVVALANRLIRIAWSILTHKTLFRPQVARVTAS